MVKLIRSKGVGIYFITQSASDIPDEVLAQLSNRVQHALRAYTPGEQKTVRAAARAFRANPAFNTEEAIMALGVGEALVSLLDENGVPSVVERARILPPQSLMGPASELDVAERIENDEYELKYRASVDRESAYEVLVRANAELAQRRQQEAEAAAAEKQRLKEEAAAARAAEREAAQAARAAEKEAEKKKKLVQQATNRAASSVVTAVSHNAVNAVTGGKITSASTITKRAAASALSSVMRSGTSSIIRGIFGSMK